MPHKLSIKAAHPAEYCALKHAIDRCHNSKHVYYHNYGGRGITVADEFRDGVMGFYKFIEEVGLRPGNEYSLDRIDNNLGYQVGNLRWADRDTQAKNRRGKRTAPRDFGHGFGFVKVRSKNGSFQRRHSPIIVHAGKSQTVVAWAEELGIAASTLRQRLMKDWPLDVALTSTKFVPQSHDLPRAIEASKRSAAIAAQQAIDLLDTSINTISKRVH